MSRLIDAENIRIKPEFMHDVCGMAMIRVEDVVRILNEQPTIQPEPHWVPVTEKLPEKNGEYIVTIQCEHVDGWDDYVTGFAEWDVDDWHLVSYYPGQIKAVAWVPLPEPFKGGG